MCCLLGGCKLSQKEWSDSHSVVSVFVVDDGATVIKRAGGQRRDDGARSGARAARAHAADAHRGERDRADG
jgi:hypothetical protein